MRSGGRRGEVGADDELAGPDGAERGPASQAGRRARAGREGGGAVEGMTPEELAADALQGAPRRRPGRHGGVARHAVDRYAGMEPGRPVGGTYYLYRTLRNLDLDGVLERLMEGARPGRRRSLTGSRSVWSRDEYEARIDAAPPGRSRPRSAAGSWPTAGAQALAKIGPQAAARGRRRHARHARGAGHRCTGRSHPLSRKLAVRLARKRRHGRKGPLDFRATVRHSLSTGGVPGRADVHVTRAGQARDHRRRRHLGLGGRLRPLHAAPRLRHLAPVLEGAQLRLRRRDRRGDPVLRRRRGHRPRRCPASTPRPT